jgi:hypothetical protein
MTLFPIIVAAINAVAPPMSGEQQDAYASDIVAAVEDECGHDDEHCLRLAMAMVALQLHESTFRKDIETCHVTGDGGNSVSGFQLQKYWFGPYSRREICNSNRYAAKRAAFVLKTHARRRTYAYAVVRYMGHGAKDNGRCSTLRRLMALPEVKAALAELKS